MANQFESLQAKIERHKQMLDERLSLDKLQNYMDDPVTLAQKQRDALIPFAPSLWREMIDLAFDGKKETVKLSALKYTLDKIFGDGKLDASEDSIQRAINSLMADNS